MHTKNASPKTDNSVCASPVFGSHFFTSLLSEAIQTE